MSEIFKYVGQSKQSFHQRLNRILSSKERELLLLPIIEELRLEHPGVAARQLYHILRPRGVGRDKFEQICFRNGFKLDRMRSFHRTTNSTGVIRFPNLVEGIELDRLNQIWVSDITYYRIAEMFYYLTIIMDVYSRMIVGYSVSNSLQTSETTLPALAHALRIRQPPRGMIFHSDGGVQYYCKSFLKLTESYGIKNSMCDVAYENAYAERINGTIKNQYLKGYNPQNFNELINMTGRAINNYNNVRPHHSLNNRTPASFERQLRPAGGASHLNDNFCIFEN
jgi:transposase InsO family protein